MQSILFLVVLLGVFYSKALAQEDEIRNSILLESVQNGDVDGIDRALQMDESIDTINVNGWSAAHFAVNAGNYAILEAVINRGIDLNLVDDSGYTALMVAASHSDLEMVELMVGANANPLLKSKQGDTAYSLAAKRHRVALVVAESCAIHAIERGDTAALLEAIEHGAYVNIHNSAGWTPLIYATAVGNVEAVQTLLRHGAEPDRQENDGWTALHFAASNGNEQLIRILLDAGASAGVRAGVAGDGFTAKEVATEEGHLEAAALIPVMAETMAAV